MATSSYPRGPLAQIARDHEELLCTIHNLHRLGVDIDAFPEIIVVGDRSSGKSSILHAFSGIDFPATGVEFTNSVLELSLRTSTEASITVEVKEKGSNTFVPLAGMTSRQTNSQAVNEIFGQVKLFMERQRLAGAAPVTALQVNVGAPHFGHIGFVDLPGLNSLPNSDRGSFTNSAASIAKEYMCKRNAIILIAVPADSTHKRETALKLCKLIDPNGERTLAIVTKADLIPIDSPHNEQIFKIFHDGQNGFLATEKWHVLPSPPRHGIYTHGVEAQSAPQPQMPTAQIEKHLPQISDYDQGFASLIPKLSVLYAGRLHANLPNLLAKGASILKCKRSDLEQLQKSLSTDAEKTHYLCGIANDFRTIAQAATKGEYDHGYFRDDSGVPPVPDTRRLRDIIRTLSRAFVHVMKTNGAHCNVKCDQASVTQPSEPDELHESMVPWVNMFQVESPKMVSLSDIKPEFVSASSVSQVPGSVSHRLSLDLFRDQSCKWYAIARRHIDLVADAVRTFVTAALGHVFGANTSGFDTMMIELVLPFFNRIALELSEKLSELLWHYRHGDMICADDDFRARLVQRQSLRPVESRGVESDRGENGILEAVEMMAVYYEVSHHSHECA
ncbi:hypothetical protein JDV02_008395 [Purpureocillium takamizusanense]|uniref:Dynamin-type G domain-containing protein n=1 Tax=Purpureocillium takamizusanense TaxID=2060973 RepID=A0A9Q8QNQ6_9HYPO|nr:uncharacterized protein JDV02_008395 [Purpureocillium takamizusanense]UNI22511.1 hypothetical protein JDV02_008395 [Purpureocillium takamizusanense]